MDMNAQITVRPARHEVTGDIAVLLTLSDDACLYEMAVTPEDARCIADDLIRAAEKVEETFREESRSGEGV